MSSVRAFAPASVSNLACGFDVLGFAVDGPEGDDGPGDVVVAQIRDRPGVEIVEITGDGGRLPLEASKNTAGVAASHLLEQAAALAKSDADRNQPGVTLRVHKRMPLASGLGSSAASAVAAVRAVDALLELGFDRQSLLRSALEGERVACGSAHPDNATPSLYGGLVLIRSNDPLDVVELPVPEGLSCALVRPHVEVETRAARQALGKTLPLATAVKQWGNLGALVAALYRNDLELLARSLVDHVAEPVRAPLVPGFREAQASALRAGALGCSLSGSGPSIFALCADPGQAERVADAMIAQLAELGTHADRLVSAVGSAGARVLEPPA